MTLSREQLVTAVATVAHDAWKADYLSKNPGKPRIKKTSDPAFLTRGVTEVDIAALSYPDLPSDWQKENKLGAEAVVDCLLEAVSKNQPLDADFVESASALAHEKWLERNGSWAPANQKLPYDQLTEDEKEKDRFFVRAAIAAYQS